MSSISGVPSNVSKLLEVATQKARTQNDIAYAVAGKQAQASKQAGDAIVELISQAADLQSQLSSGRLDVRV